MRFLTFFSLGIIVACQAGMAHAASPAVLTYQVYAGGAHVIQADLILDLATSTYHADMHAVTRGMLSTFVPWSGRYDTTGTRSKNVATVKKHNSVSTWKGSDDVAVYTYDNRGNLTSLKMTDGGVDKSPKTLDPVLTKGTTDILTATLNMMMQAGTSKSCDSQADIFDSRRRFTLAYNPQGTETLAPSRYSVFSGEAMKCTVEVIPKGGAWHKKPRGWLSIQEQGRAKGALPTMWLGAVDPTLPPVPVRIMIKTNYGTMFVHLAQAKIGDKTYTPQK